MDTFSTLSVERVGRVAKVTFLRGDQLNAMNRRMMGEITDAFRLLSDDAAVGAIVLTGDGRAFMAGADIKEYATQTEAEFAAFQKAGATMYKAIEGNAKPVIAAVNGFALGGGFEIVLCCDIVIAADNARMGLPEIKLGLVPGGGGTQRGVAKLGRNLANLLLLTGGIFPAERFVASGLVAEIVPKSDLVPHAMEFAASIAAEPPDAVEGLKRLTALASERDPTGFEVERDLVTALYRSEIGQRRVREFAARSAGNTTK